MSVFWKFKGTLGLLIDSRLALFKERLTNAENTLLNVLSHASKIVIVYASFA